MYPAQHTAPGSSDLLHVVLDKLHWALVIFPPHVLMNRREDELLNHNLLGIV